MKLLIIILFLRTVAQAQPPSADDAIMKIKRPWTRSESFVHDYDPALQTKFHPIVYRKLDSVASFFKEAYPVPTGTEAKWYPSLNKQPLFKGAPSQYSYWALFKYYYYNKALKKIMVTGETGTWAYVFFNGFGWLLADTELSMSSSAANDKMYKLAPSEGSWNGYPVYQPPGFTPGAKLIVIGRNGRLPWREVTQQEYLQSLVAKKEQERKKLLSDIDDGIAKTRKLIDDTNKEKSIPQAQKNKMIDMMQTQLEQRIQSRDKTANTASSMIDRDIQVIKEYMAAQQTETLQQTAIVSAFHPFVFRKRFEDISDKAARKVICIDKTYFDTTLPAYQPQFLTMMWRWNENAPGLHFKKSFEENFPVLKLENMIAGKRGSGTEKLVALRDQINRDVDSIINNATPPNDESTWAPLRQKIEACLYVYWQQGKLSGSRAGDGFYVRAGSNTMTQNDIQSGRLIVEIGIATIRPSEFEVFHFQKQLTHQKNR